jgi:hypothetical protein
MNDVLEGVISASSDIEKVFVYRGLRLGIGKPFFPDGPGGIRSIQIRSLGIIDEDGKWAYYVSDLDKDLATAKWQALHYVIDSMIDGPHGKYAKYASPEPELYATLVSLTNRSRDRLALIEVQSITQEIKYMLHDAWEHAKGINNPKMKNEAVDLIQEIEKWSNEENRTA